MSVASDRSNYFVRQKNMPSEILHDELVVYDGNRDVFVSSNAVGAHIWTKLKNPITVASLRDSVVAGFEDANPEIVEADTIELLNVLLEKQLIRVANYDDC